MSTHKAIIKIPISKLSKGSRARGIDWPLRLTRLGAFAALFLIPISGAFRIDVSTGFVVFDRQIWFGDFFVVFGMWLMIACTLIMLYSTMGTVFCGWVCPQNTLSSWANRLTKRYLGKSAVIDWGGADGSRVASARNTAANWTMLGGKLLLVSMGAALIPLFYFYPPGAVWSFVTLQQDVRLSGSLHWIYTVFVFIVFVNLAVVRHFACRYMCIYRMWQFLFRTRDTLHVRYDSSRASECEKCNFCVTTCTVDIDPRNTSTYDSCINCGECITACNSLHEKKGQSGLLSFGFGAREVGGPGAKSNLGSWQGRLVWVLPVFIVGCGLFGWGLANYSPYHIAVYQGSVPRDQLVTDYAVSVSHKMYREGALRLTVEGLPAEAYRLSASNVEFATAERADLKLFVDGSKLPKGVQRFTVRADADDGWVGSAEAIHIAR